MVGKYKDIFAVDTPVSSSMLRLNQKIKTMGITFSAGILITIILWVFFGYIWDYPLQKIRNLSLAKVHIMYIFVLPIVFLYVFFPEWTASKLDIPTYSIRIVGITLTGTLSFMYYYASKTRHGSPKTNYDTTDTAKNTATFILVSLCICMIGLCMFFFEGIFNLYWILALIISIWLGLSIQVILLIETELFLIKTKHA